MHNVRGIRSETFSTVWMATGGRSPGGGVARSGAREGREKLPCLRARRIPDSGPREESGDGLHASPAVERLHPCAGAALRRFLRD